MIINCAALELNLSNLNINVMNFEWLDNEE